MSILDPSYMIDLGGIDVIQSQGVAIPGLYQKLLDNIGPCGNPLIYNWKFNGVFIPPQYIEPILEDDKIYINDIYVSSDDVVHIPSVSPPPIEPVIVQLNVLENGTYEVPEGIDGFNPVEVNVSGIHFVVDSYSPLLFSIFDSEAPINSGNTIEVAFFAESYVNDGHIIGQSYSGGGQAFHLTTYNNRWFYGGIGEGSFDADSDCPLYGSDIVYRAKTGEISMNGVVKATNFTMPSVPTATYKLNTRGGSISTRGVYKYKFVKVYDSSNELVCNWEFGHMQIGSFVLYLAHEKVHDTYKQI